MTSHDELDCSCQRCRQRLRRQVDLCGRDAPGRHHQRRHLTHVTSSEQQRSVWTAADTRFFAVEPWTSSSRGPETASDQKTQAVRSERSRLDEELWFVSRTSDAEYADIGVRRCRRRRVDASTSRRVSRTGTRHRVFHRCTTVRRRCALVVDRRHAADVTSGDDVTTASCLDGADSGRGVTKWRPDLSPIAAAPDKWQRRTAEDHDVVSNSTDSPCIASSLTLPTACDTVRYASLPLILFCPVKSISVVVG